MDIGFKRTNCGHSVYIYFRNNVRIIYLYVLTTLTCLELCWCTSLHQVPARYALSNFMIVACRLLQCRGWQLHTTGVPTHYLNHATLSLYLATSVYLTAILLMPMKEGCKFRVRCHCKTWRRSWIWKRSLSWAHWQAPVPGHYLTRNFSHHQCPLSFVEHPGGPHWDAAKRLLRYLKGTMNMALVHSCLLSPYLFIAFCGAGLGGNPDNGWSTNGFAVCMGIVLSSGSRLHFFFLVGERGNASCTIAPEAPCVGLQQGLPLGLCPLDSLPCVLPTKNPSRLHL